MSFISPDCRDRFKHDACSGDAFDPATDAVVPCSCDCHEDLPTHLLGEQPEEPPAAAVNPPGSPPVPMDPLDVCLSIFSSIDVNSLTPDQAIAYASGLATTVLALATRDSARLTHMGMQASGMIRPANGLVMP